jgi:hypothetical protein
MKIQWLRVLLGGLLIEVVLFVVLLGGFAAAGVDISTGVSTSSAVIIGVGCFAAAFGIVWWLGRGIGSRLVLHGVLMGLVATLLYVGLIAGSGQMAVALAAYGPATFVIVNAMRMLGAVAGGVVAARAKNAPQPAVL